MAKMGKYCKAYPIERFREYPGWAEKARPVNKGHLYLQENYVVTEGIFLDEEIVFDDVTPEWIEFCQETLQFRVPDFKAAPQAEPSDSP
ncbi:MAG: hypothetical protein D6759_15295 [Chloroflexi bacterium]|nr:MAG: hypothetical protein D6759_15295 [Chloroflexota bacterium]